jgi:hypothetical protein
MSKHMLVLDLSCPQCANRLTEGARVTLNAFIRSTHREGEMHLSAIFGDYSLESDVEIAEGDIAEFHCPKCDASLMLPLACKLCGAPMASLNLTAGGYVEFCARRGCKGHALGGVGDIDQMMSLMNKRLDTPYD